MEGKKICVVGAGVSGLATCKYLAGKGFRPVVFESDRAVGGVWTKTPASTRLQSFRWEYQYSDHPWPETVAEDCPDGRKVLAYIESYARRFDLMKYVRFEEKVVALEFAGAGEEVAEDCELWAGNGQAFGDGGRGKWNVTVQSQVDGSSQVYVMDFVVLCVGRFSGLPHIPSFPMNKGPEIFHGDVIHSMDYAQMGGETAARMVSGKRITVVGFRKSAMDIAAECAAANGRELPCTMIIRTKRWNISEFKAWGVPLHYLYLNRFSELLFHKPGEGLWLSILATLLSPLAWLISKFVESYFKRVIPMKKYGMVPEHSFFEAISSCLVCALPDKFYKKVEEGSIVLKPCNSFHFCEKGVIVEGDDSSVDTDLVIFGTGFRGDQKLRDLFASPHFQKIVAGSPDCTVPLYRECIHPQIPQLAIIGYSENFSNLYISEMRARWLAHFIDGIFKLPNKKEMEQNVKEWDKHMKRYSKNYYRRSCITPLHIWYNDQLCKDMGCNPRRKRGLLADWFLPYEPIDYTNLEVKR